MVSWKFNDGEPLASTTVGAHGSWHLIHYWLVNGAPGHGSNNQCVPMARCQMPDSIRWLVGRSLHFVGQTPKNNVRKILTAPHRLTLGDDGSSMFKLSRVIVSGKHLIK